MRLPLVAFTFVCALSLCMCEKPPAVTARAKDQAPDQSAPKKVEEKHGLLPSIFPSLNKVAIPVDRVLTDNQGRSLDATIVGKSADAVQVVRKSDGLNAEIAIANLAENDRAFVEALDAVSPPDGFLVGRKKESGKKEPDPYIKSRLDEIARLEEENSRLQIEADSTTNSMVSKNRLNTIDKNEEEIEKLRTAIQLYRSSK